MRKRFASNWDIPKIVITAGIAAIILALASCGGTSPAAVPDKPPHTENIGTSDSQKDNMPSSDKNQEPDFGKAIWGMSREEIESAEGRQFDYDSSDITGVYAGYMDYTFLGYESPRMRYYFNDSGELERGVCWDIDEYPSIEECKAHYQDLKKSLDEKYGSPLIDTDNQIWREETFEGKPVREWLDDYVSEDECLFRSFTLWKTDRSEIGLIIIIFAENEDNQPEPYAYRVDTTVNVNSFKNSNDRTPAKEPNESEKAAIMEKYGISEETYEDYKKEWQRPVNGGQVAGMPLDEYIGMMEEQTATHDDPNFPG